MEEGPIGGLSLNISFINKEQLQKHITVDGSSLERQESINSTSGTSFMPKLKKITIRNYSPSYLKRFSCSTVRL
jgi:hypothetical protein